MDCLRPISFFLPGFSISHPRKRGGIYERFDGVPFTQEDFEKCKIDKAFITDKAIKYKIYGVSGLRKGKKIIAIVANNNGDLSDEIVMEFSSGKC